MRPSLSLKPALDALQNAMNQRFERLLPLTDDPRRRLYEAMRHGAMNGGKRMRPLLVVASCELFHLDKDRALWAAAAVEAVHCYSLIHDDLPCMDDDDLRRGKPTVHKAFDEGTAVLAGDGLLSLAFEVLADPITHEDPRVRVELVHELARAVGPSGMVGGQAMDMAAETTQFDLATTARLQQLKTGALIGFSVEAGAIMGRANAEQRMHLRGYANDLGMAFQIVDDLLDVEGDSDKTGKALRKDAEAGKSTFVSLMGVERARRQAGMLIDQAIAHLGEFGHEADLLRAVARFALERDH